MKKPMVSLAKQSPRDRRAFYAARREGWGTLDPTDTGRPEQKNV